MLDIPCPTLKIVVHILVSVFLLSGATCFAQSGKDPYRKVGTNYYDLTQLYKWASDFEHARDAEAAQSNQSAPHKSNEIKKERPLTEWDGDIIKPVIIPGILIEKSHIVAKSFPDGLLIQDRMREKVNGTDHTDNDGELYLLRHFPIPRGLKIGDSITFISVPSEPFTYTNQYGALRTVKSRDYGVPVTVEEYSHGKSQ